MTKFNKTQNADADNEHLDTVWELISKLDYCMMVTHSSGEFRGRPMSSILRRDKNQIAFLSESKSSQIPIIQQAGPIMLNYSDGRSFVAVYGHGTVSHDLELVKELWNPGAQAFWPAGPEKSRVVAILTTPEFAEYWLSANSIVSTVKFIVGLATKTVPDLGENAAVKM